MGEDKVALLDTEYTPCVFRNCLRLKLYVTAKGCNNRQNYRGLSLYREPCSAVTINDVQNVA